ncbi:endonuclease/exonuclease/phosphatase family protein [Undibacterium sp. Jales W-56]|uniref:endonuclease/exonuclease/phosphatase family protein n=1 Tax=Undibacterium sp. Jales W-56 TaxID=2897325 RepID=UPI0021CF61FB|nr:endonuclease/exonuclease/phosphatase family protein [Undibacterium sp. Jales W-56]MCU6432290.1 endonuclease/exonuclease/phosphatase family protein [Undibacterium sp. Jales W-56]
MKLRIATYNIHKGVSAFGRRARIHAIKEAIDLLDADLIFLQEVQGQHDHHAVRHAHWPGQAQHDFLAGDSHHSSYGMNAVYEHGHHGNALLSRFAIAASTNHDVSDHAYEQRGILHSVIQAPAADIHCFVIHLGLFAASRRRQVQALIHEIQSSLPPDAPLIIAGDFNDWRNHLSTSLYESLGVREVFDDGLHQLPGSQHPLQKKIIKTGRTFPAGLPWLSLDRVYVRGFAVEQAQVLTGAPWNKLSDHVPILATLHYAAPCISDHA